MCSGAAWLCLMRTVGPTHNWACVARELGKQDSACQGEDDGASPPLGRPGASCPGSSMRRPCFSGRVHSKTTKCNRNLSAAPARPSRLALAANPNGVLLAAAAAAVPACTDCTALHCPSSGYSSSYSLCLVARVLSSCCWIFFFYLFSPPHPPFVPALLLSCTGPVRLLRLCSQLPPGQRTRRLLFFFVPSSAKENESRAFLLFLSKKSLLDPSANQFAA